MGVHSLYTEAQWDWVHERWQEGHAQKELAEWLGVADCTVSTHIKERKKKMPRHSVDMMAAAPLRPLEGREGEFNKLGG